MHYICAVLCVSQLAADLDGVVVEVRDDEVAVGVGGDVVRPRELPGLGPPGPEFGFHFAVGGKDEDSAALEDTKLQCQYQNFSS